MNRQSHSRRNLILTSLLTLSMFATTADAKRASWSKSNRSSYQSAKRTQVKSAKRYGTYRARSRKQMKTYERTNNPKQLSWARQNKVRSVRAKVSTWKAKARQMESRAKAANNSGNKAKATKLRASASVLNKRAARVNTAISRYITKHNLFSGSSRAKPAMTTALVPYKKPGALVPYKKPAARNATVTNRIKSGTKSTPRRSYTGEKKREAREYNLHRTNYVSLKNQANQLKQQAIETNNPALLRQSIAARALAGRSEAKMYRAQAKSLTAKAARNPKNATRYLSQAKALNTKADRKMAAVKRYASSLNRATRQFKDTERAPGVDGPSNKAAPTATSGMASYKGKKVAKIQMKNGNISAAVATLMKMEARAPRKGVRGWMDKRRISSTRKRILKQSYKTGKRAAKNGDTELAQEALGAISHLGKSERYVASKFNGIANAAMGNPLNRWSKGARGFAKKGNPEQAAQMLDFARSIQMHVGRTKPTIRYRLVRRSANKRVWKAMKKRAKNGNMEGFRSTMRLANAYAKEAGGKLSKRKVKKIRKLYMVAKKQSVIRALDDAKMLVSGKLGYSNVEEAAKRLNYAEHTANALARRGVTVKTGLLKRGINTKFRKTRAMLVKAFGAQNNLNAGRPGLLKRVFEKWLKQPHRRTRPSVAPMDQVFEGKMQRQQQKEAMAQQGMTPEMMQAMQAQGGGQMGQQTQGPRDVTPTMQRQGISE